MSDDADFTVVDDVLPPVRQETRTWARLLIDGVREVQALHHPVTKFGAYDTAEEAEAAGETSFESAVICAECTQVAEDNAGGDAWTWQDWPCRTATALGIVDGPVL